MEIKLTIPLPPVTKKNSQRILRNRATGRRFIAPSEAYENYEKAAVLCLKHGSEPPISRPVRVTCLFYMPTRRRVDLVNLLEAACDVLVAAGVLADDNAQIVASHDGSRVRYDKQNPRTEIVIEEMEDDEKPL